jgi:hypothetical protein
LRCAKLCDLVRPSTSSTPIPIGIAHHRKREAQGIIVGPSIAPRMAPALPPQGLCLSLFVEPASEFDLSLLLLRQRRPGVERTCTTVPMLSKTHSLHQITLMTCISPRNASFTVLFSRQSLLE